MALQFQFTDKTGVVHPEAYARVIAICLSYERNDSQVAVDIFSSESARRGGREAIEHCSFIVPEVLAGPDVRATAYARVKESVDGCADFSQAGDA